MEIRKADIAEIPLMRDIMVRSFRSAFAAFVSEETMTACTNEKNCLALLEGVYREPTMHFLTDGKCGMLVWQEQKDCAEIVALHTLPESRGTGLGRALLEEALHAIGSRPVFLWAFRENTRARRFYEKNGFRQDGASRVSEFDGAVEVRYTKEVQP